MSHSKPCRKADDCPEFAHAGDTDFMRRFVGSKHFIACLTAFGIIGGDRGLRWLSPPEPVPPAVMSRLDSLDRKVDILNLKVDLLAEQPREGRRRLSMTETNVPERGN